MKFLGGKVYIFKFLMAFFVKFFSKNVSSIYTLTNSAQSFSPAVDIINVLFVFFVLFCFRQLKLKRFKGKISLLLLNYTYVLF